MWGKGPELPCPLPEHPPPCISVCSPAQKLSEPPAIGGFWRFPHVGMISYLLHLQPLFLLQKAGRVALKTPSFKSQLGLFGGQRSSSFSRAKHAPGALITWELTWVLGALYRGLGIKIKHIFLFISHHRAPPPASRKSWASPRAPVSLNSLLSTFPRKSLKETKFILSELALSLRPPTFYVSRALPLG